MLDTRNKPVKYVTILVTEIHAKDKIIEHLNDVVTALKYEPRLNENVDIELRQEQ